MKIENILGMTGISIDTRTLVPGDVFVAIKGEQCDGHDFIEMAIEKGASMVIACDKTPLKKSIAGCPILKVEDTIQAIGELAHLHRLQFNVPVIGITGSNGKTTVKSMVGSIFSQFSSPLVTQGNLNNHLGVPLTLSRLKKEHEVAIIEMGANGMDDIRYLCMLAKPTITLVNNVMNAHLAGFGSLEGVSKAKGQIYKELDSEGTAILNTDLDPSFVTYFKSLLKNQKQVSFGLKRENHPDITAKDIQLNTQFSEFTLVSPQGEIAIHCPVSGQHNVLNALAASSIALAAGVSLEQIAQGLANFSSVKGRLQSFETSKGASLIDDTYNANPGSFEAAIEVLSVAKGSKVLVMGDMGELGEMASSLHEHIGQLAREKGIDRLFAVGKLSESAVRGFGQGGQFYDNKKALVKDLVQLLGPQMTCLVKGSRSAQMETVVHDLLQDSHSHQIVGER